MTQRLKRILLVLPISFVLLAGCGSDDGDDTSSSDSGSENGASDEGSGDGSDEGSGEDASSGGLNPNMDFCTLVSDETLAASNLSASDGEQKEWVGSPACVYGENLDRRIIVAVDFGYALGPIEEGDEGVQMIDGVPVEVGYDSEMTCLYSFSANDEIKVDVIVEDLGDTELTPGEPCDAGDPALADVVEKVG